MTAPHWPPRPGEAQSLEPGLTLVLAPNPSPMTEAGTNSYLLGHDSLAVIDPGPDDPRHRAALLAAIGGRRVSHVIVTHSHLDHSPLARPLARTLGAPVLAFGGAQAGRSAVMERLAAEGLAGGGEGIDHAFVPDEILPDGARITGDGWEIEALHTPGHIGNHLCLRWGDAVFTGDHVMGWASSLVSPPDGDLTDFMTSCARLARWPARVYYPGHGAPVTDPAARLAWLVAHRQGREAQIRAALGPAPVTVPALTRRLYADVPSALLPAAERNVFAHLVDLCSRGLARAHPRLSFDAVFSGPSEG